jgi:hypothetical protein
VSNAPLIPVEERNTSSALGSLYRHGVVSAKSAEGQPYWLKYFPSPDYLNRLSEQLDLRPGEDVLKFVNHEGGQIPASEYVGHLAVGEFPQATQGIWFEHDRLDDHAPGVLFSPPIVARKAMEFAIALNPNSRFSSHQHQKTIQVARDYDRVTSQINSFVKRNDARLRNGLDGLDPADTADYYYLYQNAMFFEMRYVRFRHLGISKRIAEIMIDHLAELIPKIERLQEDIKV